MAEAVEESPHCLGSHSEPDLFFLDQPFNLGEDRVQV